MHAVKLFFAKNSTRERLLAALNGLPNSADSVAQWEQRLPAATTLLSQLEGGFTFLNCESEAHAREVVAAVTAAANAPGAGAFFLLLRACVRPAPSKY